MKPSTYTMSFEEMQAHLATLPTHGPDWWNWVCREQARNPVVGSEPFEPDTEEAKRIMDAHMAWIREHEGEKTR